MTKAFVDSKYFSGQGVLMLAPKDPTTGNPMGFVPIGNVPDLKLGIAVTKYSHKESQSGARGTDFEQTQEVGLTTNFTLEHFDKDNLAMVAYGGATSVAAATAVTATIVGYEGKWTALPHLKVSSVVVKNEGGTVTYDIGDDYELNTDAGSILVLATGDITDGDVLSVTYNHAIQERIEGLTSSAAPIRWARFEGLNTADADAPVIVNVFKLSIQPLAELALIQDEVAGFAVECKGLSDGTRSTGSKYWNLMKG